MYRNAICPDQIITPLLLHFVSEIPIKHDPDQVASITQNAKVPVTKTTTTNSGPLTISNTSRERKRTKQAALHKEMTAAKRVILKAPSTAQGNCPVAVVTPQENVVSSSATTNNLKMISSTPASSGNQSRAAHFPTQPVPSEITRQHEGYQGEYNVFREFVPGALERSYIVPNITLNSGNFVGAPWLATDAQSLAILNTITLTDSSAQGMLTRDNVYSASRAPNEYMVSPYPGSLGPRVDGGPSQGKEDLNGNSYFTSVNMSAPRGANYAYYDPSQGAVLPAVGSYPSTGLVNGIDTLTPLRISTAGAHDVQMSEVGV